MSYALGELKPDDTVSIPVPRIPILGNPLLLVYIRIQIQ